MTGLEAWTATHLHQMLAWLALPEHGLGALFLISFVSATLLPLASEPAVFGLVKLSPELFWPAILVATAGNTLGGMVSYAMGRGVHRAVDEVRHTDRRGEHRALRWLSRWGPAACVLSFLPVVGDPLCAVAGWLRLPPWRCAGWMLLGKFMRYALMTASLLWWFPGALQAG